MSDQLLKQRREGVFGIAVLIAGLAITSLCLMPMLLWDTVPKSFLPTPQQQRFFFDALSILCGCWLVCWVSALNNWTQVAKVGQWLGIILLCIQQAILVNVWREVSQDPAPTTGAWLAPAVIQVYVIGYFFAFFTLPSLTQTGNRRLTGLGTLLLLLPWLVGRSVLVSGTDFLRGLSF